MERKKLIKLIQYALIALCALTLVCMPIVASYGPSWARKYRTSKAASSDPKTRELGLNYIIKNAPRDAGTRQAAVELMAKTTDQANFLQIMRALDYAGVWNRQTVPAHTYLRWLGIIAKDPNPKNRMIASQFIGELSDIADDPAVAILVSLIMNDTDAEARYAALVACADLAHAGNNPTPFITLIKERTQDPNKILAQQAWLMLGSLKAADTIPPDLAKLPDAVAQAAAWALIVSDAKGAEDAIRTLVITPSTSIATRTGAVYALKHGKDPSTVTTLQLLLSRLSLPSEKTSKTATSAKEIFQLSPANSWLLWRATLAFPFIKDQSQDIISAMDNLTAMRDDKVTLDEPVWNMLFCAAYHTRYQTQGQAFADPTQRFSLRDLPDDAKSKPMFTLAALEGIPRGRLTNARPASDSPDSIKLATLRASDAIQEEDIYPLLSHDAAFIRDQACIIAWQNMNKEAQSALVAKLLKDYNDNAKMSGGFLAGLTGVQKELLDRRARDEDVWAVKQVLRMGQFMQSPDKLEKPLTQEHQNLRGLLMRADLPRSTLTLGLLYRHDEGPLEFLLNPKGEPYLPLIDMFDDKRWWHALKPMLPNDMPGFEVWADPGLMSFQIDLMRNWFLVNKRKLTWPDHK